MGNKCLYVFDTSSLFNVSDINHSEDVWELIIRLVNEGRIKTVAYVMEELERVKQEAYLRLKELSKELVVNISSQLYEEAGRITYQYRNMSRPRCTFNIADPWVVALAKISNGTVVTDENNKRRRMPKVCNRENIPFLNLEKFIQSEKQ